MSQRDLREKSGAKRPDETAESLVTQAARARMARLTGAGVSGLGASTMAFVVGGCLALGYFAGTWLDARYNTTHWMPIGVFVGLAASVREMFRTLKHLNAQTQRDLEKRKAAKKQQIEMQAATQHRVLDVRETPGKREAYNDTEPETIRPRIFHVPPPPLASFDDGFIDNGFAQNEDETDEVFDEALNEAELEKLLREAEIIVSDDEKETKSL